MGFLDKIFNKDEKKASTEKPKAAKKVAKRDPSTPNQKEVYRMEKARRREEAQKAREEQARLEAEKLEAEKIERDRLAKEEEARREAELKAAREAAEAKQEVKEEKVQKVEEPVDLYGFSIETLAQGDIIEVEILADARENYLARSTKNFQEVYLPKNELKLDEGEHFVRVGDTLEVLVYRHTNDDFYVSLRRLKNKQQMKDLMQDTEEIKVIRGHVLSYKEPFYSVRLQNGMLGDVFVRNIDTKFVDDPEQYVGNDYNFTIKQEREDREVLYELDRRPILAQELKLRAAKLEEGQVIEIKDYSFNKGGLEFDFDGIRGFVPMRELSHGYVKGVEQAELIIQGEQKVKITEVQTKGHDVQILGSIKALIELPEINVDDVIEIKEYSFNKGGLEFDYQGIRGFVPMRELAHGFIKDAKEAKTVITGDQSIKVVGIDENRGSMQILGSIKALTQPPFAVYVNNNQEGDVVTGKVLRKENYGLFIELASEVRGLLHNNDISTEIAALIKEINDGDELTVKIKTIDLEKQQINLTSDLNEEVAAE